MVGQSLTVHPKLNGEAASRAENDFPESFEPRKINRFIIKLGCLFASGMCFLSLASVHAGIYYVSPNGSTTNSGFSTNTPWSLGKINYNSSIPSNSTIIILPGIYEETNKQNTTAGPVIYSPYVTVKSEIKWGAVLRDSSDYGIQAQTNNVTIDGLRIINALKCGINGSAAFGVDSNLVVQNCWISYCGTNPISGVGPSGIANGYANNQIVQDNLIEHIGNTHQAIYDHGIYLAGNNIIIKNNVVRYCSGAGIQLNDHTPGCYGSSNVLIFNNLIYSNGNWGMYLSSDGSNNVSTTIYNNTVYGSPYALAAETLIPGITYMNCSNNILLATTAQTLKESHAFSTNSVINADFNLMAKVDHLPVGSHSIITDCHKK